MILLQLLILLPSTLWLSSSSPTHSHYSVVAGSLPLPLDRSLWWKGERGKGEESPGPGGAKRPFWQARITRSRTRRRIRTGRLGSAWGVVRDVTVVGEVPAPACGQCDRCL
jgi:hypothetical protein